MGVHDFVAGRSRNARGQSPCLDVKELARPLLLHPSVNIRKPEGAELCLRRGAFAVQVSQPCRSLMAPDIQGPQLNRMSFQHSEQHCPITTQAWDSPAPGRELTPVIVYLG